MEITVYKNDKVGKRTKEVIGKFEPEGVELPTRKKIKLLLLKSGVARGFNIDWDMYQDHMDLIQKSAGYSDEMLEKYPDNIIDMILSQTYLAWQPSEKKS